MALDFSFLNSGDEALSVLARQSSSRPLSVLARTQERNSY